MGPIAANLEDLQVAYRIMSIPDPLHPTSSSFPHPLMLNDPFIKTRKRIATYSPWFDDCSPNVRALCNAAVSRLQGSGYELIPLPSIPYLNESRLAHATSILTELSCFVKGDTAELSSANKILLSVGLKTPAPDLIAANKVRTLMMSHFASLWEKYPGLILLTPTTPQAGVKIKERELTYGVSDANTSLASMRYVFLANFIGTPSINVGVGYDEGEGGMPVSLMAMSEWGTEEELLGWAADMIKCSVATRRRGQTWVDVLGDVSAKRATSA